MHNPFRSLRNKQELLTRSAKTQQKHYRHSSLLQVDGGACPNIPENSSSNFSTSPLNYPKINFGFGAFAFRCLNKSPILYSSSFTLIPYFSHHSPPPPLRKSLRTLSAAPPNSCSPLCGPPLI